VVCDQGSLVGLCIQDYTSLCVQQLQLCRHSDTQTDSVFISVYEQVGQLSWELNTSVHQAKQHYSAFTDSYKRHSNSSPTNIQWNYDKCWWLISP